MRGHLLYSRRAPSTGVRTLDRPDGWRAYAIVAPRFVVEVDAPDVRHLMAAMWFMCRNAYEACDAETGEVVLPALTTPGERSEWLEGRPRGFESSVLARIVRSARAAPVDGDARGDADTAVLRCRQAALLIRGVRTML